MSQRSFETAVKGATKVKLAPPKSKYIEVILLATQSGEAGVAEIFRTLTHRLRDSTWTVVFKALIVVHLMIKEGTRDVTLSYLSAAPSHRLAINNFTDVQAQGQNIRRYTEYLIARAKAYQKTNHDHVLLLNKGHLKSLSVDKGILREAEIILDQIKMLTRCEMMEHDQENEISLTAFRLLTRDLLDLFGVMNEAVMNVLQHYFEMSRPDAERAVKIYRRFCEYTEKVVGFLRVAQQRSHAMRMEIPKIKHAPIDLANTLQEYLDDKDFDINRRQYLAQQEAKRNGKPVSTASFAQNGSAAKSAPARSSTAISTPTSARASGPAPDLIDFFDSIEQKQQPMAQNPGQATYTSFDTQAAQVYGQPGQFVPQQRTAVYTGAGQVQYVQQQPQYTGINTNMTGYGGFASQPQPQPIYDQFGAQPFQPAVSQSPVALEPQSTNPFRKSMIMPMPTGQQMASPIQPQNTNPFARQAQAPQMPQIPQQFQTPPPQPQQMQPLQTQRTGTNPFAPAQPVQQPAAPLQMQPTGSTNPFRQSMFVNQQTGTGWQNSSQGTMGGLEQLPTVPVFPRPGGDQMQYQQQASPWH